jgi:hypothetical protein
VPLRTDAAIRRLGAQGLGMKTITKRVGCGVGTVQQVVTRQGAGWLKRFILVIASPN